MTMVIFRSHLTGQFLNLHDQGALGTLQEHYGSPTLSGRATGQRGIAERGTGKGGVALTAMPVS